ncbi:MAG TPA: hypothetical protein VET48_07945 [Steroidobacteraceae bacterium]|nr:hypothetical protein [Steroidobacteraceae bacterium]
MTLQTVALILAALGALLLIIGLRRLIRARFVTGSGSLLMSLLFLAVASVIFVVATNLHTYARLTYEAKIAELIFEARGPQRFQATITRLPSGDRQALMLNGDEWQLDARVLKWRGWANLLGLDAQYRLERLSGRYRNIDQERTAQRSVYGLSDNPGIDLWAWAQQHPNWLPFVDSIYGSATFLPMADGARYSVSLTQSGLIARAINPAADNAAKVQR